MNTTTPPLDPFEMWRQIINKFETGINSMANNSMNSEQFTRALQQFSQVSTGMQQTFEKALDGYFKAVRLPSRSDVLALEERLQRIEDKLDAALPDSREPAESRPERTRKPGETPAANASKAS
ncbi:hypothetical protein GCM10019059_43250 [Camelimonas fluminis]|uniref:Poly(3-hydroxyalkanoate) polymerase subunit PhaE n=1 Tax=Camelimonas fluminis TaxID=1576911 RepID=A0ABV7UH37_9HYPH|nr:hypothetical protein [Camelimonas fluminis]GHE80358.1 hypothetical protein GCM10019059_43250 [Camelimonas fluminis]